jgi:hypothetical protein
VADRAWERSDVSGWPIREIEQAGSHPSHWLQEPDTGQRWLHKDTLTPANGNEQGEDWSEVVSTQVAILLGVPCASTRLCLRNGRRGSISRSVRPPTYALNEGRVVLESARAPGYFPHEEGSPGIDPSRPATKRPGHNLVNIRQALLAVDVPPAFDGPQECGGFDVFVGYLLLDALIANRDRHEHNWAVLTPQLTTSSERLSPTYDHASSPRVQPLRHQAGSSPRTGRGPARLGREGDPRGVSSMMSRRQPLSITLQEPSSCAPVRVHSGGTNDCGPLTSAPCWMLYGGVRSQRCQSPPLGLLMIYSS